MAPEIEYSQTHGKAVDIWSLGMITVFLLAPDSIAAGSFVKISQAAITEWLNSVLLDLSHQKISENCREFIRSCLMFEPRRRIDASEAKHHSWFQHQPDRKRFKFHIRENTEAWKKAARIIAPPVQELPDMENIEAAQLTHQVRTDNPSTSIESRKRKIEVTTLETNISQESPYFSGKSTVPKRLKLVGDEDRIPRTEPEINIICATPTEQAASSDPSPKDHERIPADYVWF